MSAWSALLSAFRNEAGEAIVFFRGDARDFTAEKRGDDFFRRAIEECFDKVPKSGAAGDLARHGRNIDVAEAVFLVADVSLLLQDAKLGADGRVAGLASH